MNRLSTALSIAGVVALACASAAGQSSSEQDRRVRPIRVTPGTPPVGGAPNVTPIRPTFIIPTLRQPAPRVLLPNSAPDPFGAAPRPLPRDPADLRLTPARAINAEPGGPGAVTGAADLAERARALAAQRSIDRSRIGFTSGGGAFYVDKHGFARGLNHGDDFFGSGPCGSFSNERPSIRDTYIGIGEGPLDPILAEAFPPAPEVPPARRVELPVAERAALALRRGHTGDATELYAEVVAADPADARARRQLALARLYHRDLKGAAETMLAAYASRPALAAQPIDPEALPGGPGTVRGRLVDMVNHAHRRGSADAWLAVVVLMQAEGRSAVALRTLPKAEAAGLSPEVAQALRLALTGK